MASDEVNFAKKLLNHSFISYSVNGCYKVADAFVFYCSCGHLHLYDVTCI